jgi:hypothetical protein
MQPSRRVRNIIIHITSHNVTYQSSTLSDNESPENEDMRREFFAENLENVGNDRVIVLVLKP